MQSGRDSLRVDCQVSSLKKRSEDVGESA